MIPNHTKIQPFDLKKQKLVFDVFYTQFSEQIETDNCFLLTDVGQKISNALKEKGFPGAKINVFRACPQYFICGYDTEKHTDTFKAEAVAVVGHEAPPRFISEEEFRKKEEANIANKLKKHFQMNEVPLRDVEDFLKKQNIDYTDIYELIQQDLPDMELKELSLGEGYPIENFLVIHPPKDVPEDIKDQIIWIIKNLFADKPTAKNTDLGAAFHKFGIKYTDYDYLHLTAFIRSFREFFSIIPVKNGDENKVDIIVKLLHPNVQQYDVSALDSAMFEKLAKSKEQTNGKKTINDPHFRNGILETYQKGSYEILTEKIYMSYGLNHLDDTAIWTVYINAFLKRGIFQKASEYTLNAWEKAVFPLNLADMETMWKDKNQMEDFGFSEEEIQALEPLFHREHNKVTNVNALAMRLATFLPQNSLLPEIMHHISLLQSEKAIRESGIRNLSTLYLTQNNDEELFQLWEHHLSNITFRSAARTFSACMEQRKHALIRPLWEKLPQEIATHSNVSIYPAIADYLQNLPDAEAEEAALLKALSTYQEKEQLSHLTEVCQVLLWQENYLAICTLFGALLTTYPRRKSNRLLSQLYTLLVPHEKTIVSSLNEAYHPTQMKLCAFGEFLLPRNIDGSLWESKREEVIAFYREQIAAVQGEEALSLVETALSIFPEDTDFTQTHIRLLEEKYINASQEEPYKEIFIELSKKKNHLAMISLSESDKLTRYQEEIWYQELMLSAYRHEAALAKAIRLQASLLAGMHYKHQKYSVYAQALSNDLYDLFYWMADSTFPEDISPAVLLKYLRSLIRNPETNSYLHAAVIVQLLMLNGKYLAAALIYAITVTSNTIPKEIVPVVHRNRSILAEHLPRLTEEELDSTDLMLQHVLTTLSRADITLCLSIGQCLLTMDKFETSEAAYRTNRNEWGDNYSLSKMIIATFFHEKSWRIYAKNTISNPAVAFVARYMLVQQFNDTKDSDRPLPWCAAALHRHNPEELPENLLNISYTLLEEKPHLTMYWNGFVSYVKATKAFSTCDPELLEKYFSVASTHNQLSGITLEILKQAKDSNFLQQYLSEDNSLNENAVQILGVDALLSLVLHYLQENNTLTEEQTTIFADMLTYAKKHAKSTRQKAAGLWIEELLEKFIAEGNSSDYFQVSFQLLKKYPDIEHIDFLAEDNPLPYQNYCNLLDRWLEINPDFDNAKILYAYYIRLSVSKDENQRQLHFHCLSNALTKWYKTSVPSDASRAGVLRTGKNLLTLYFVNNYYQESKVRIRPSELVNKLEDKLYAPHEKKELTRLVNSLIGLWEANFPRYFRDYLIICGISNHWDDFLLELMEPSFDRSLLTHEAIRQYLTVVDYPKLNRRLLQMLIYAKIANFNLNKAEEEQIATSHFFYNTAMEWAENGILTQQYFDNLTQICQLSGNEMTQATISFCSLPENELKELLLSGVLLVQNKPLFPMLTILLDEISNPHADILVNLVFLMQYLSQVIDAMEALIQQEAPDKPDNFLTLLQNPVFTEKIGKFYSAYLLAEYYHTLNEFEKAEQALPDPEICPEECFVKYNCLKNAILQQSEFSAAVNFSTIAKLPKLSFMEALSPAPGEQYNDLLIRFDSDNQSTNEETMIQLAKKIYHFILSGEDCDDYAHFALRWGFLEIATADSYDARIHILSELTELTHLAENPEAFKEAFLEAFLEIILPVREQIIFSHFESIQTVGRHIAQQYHQDAISEALSLLSPVAKDAQLPSKNFEQQLVQLSYDSTLLLARYADNQIVQKCCDLIDDYKTKLESKGSLEIKVLNEGGFSSGSVFYTVKNTGLYSVEDVEVTLYLLNNGRTIHSVSTDPIGLNKEQTMTGEVEIKDFFQEIPSGEKMTVRIKVSYSCQEHESTTLHEEFTLTSKTEEYHYSHKSGPDFLIHRMELDNIYNTICNKNIVMLYGTNGTGKTSLLKLVRNRLSDNNTSKSHTFTVLLAENKSDRSTKEILKDVMKSFCYCEDSIADTSSVYEQLKTFLSYSSASPETQQTMLSKYREYVSCSTEDSQATFGNLINLLKNLDAKFMEFKKYFGYDFKFCLLWDAFEKVISSIKPEDMNFKNLIDTFKGEESQIRIVFTGSNKLLEVAEVKNDADPWNIMFRDINGEASIKVGNLNPKDFEAIITDPNLLNNGEIHFSQAALDFLYQYTNGHIRYSKMFVDQALEILDKRSVNRRCIYPSDLKIHGSDCESANNEQLVAKNLTAQIFQDITQDYDVINVGITLANMVSDGNQPVPSIEVQNTALSDYHNITAQRFRRAIEILKARDFIIEEPDKFHKPTYRFTSVLYLHHFLNRDFTVAEPVEEESTINKLIQEIEANKKFSIDDVNRLYEALGKRNNNTVNITNIENQYNDHAVDQSIGTQTNIQINAQTIATTFNAMLTADPKEVKKLFSSLPMASGFIAESQKEALQSLYEKLEVQEKRPVNPFSEDAKERQNEQAAIEEQISEIVEPAITEMHNTYKNAVMMAEDTIDQFEPWKILGLKNKAEYEVMTCRLKAEFVADLYFAAKLDYLFQIMKEEESVDFSPVTIMYCKLIEKMLKFYHTDIYADKLQDSSTQNSLKDPETNKDRLILFGDLKNDTTLNPSEIKHVRNKIMIGAFLYPINPYFGNMQSRKLLSDDDSRLEAKWKFHGKALSEISRTRNDSAHGSSNRRITADRLDTLKCWLFAEKELQTIVELSLAHREGKEFLTKIEEENKKRLKLFSEESES